MADRPNFLLLSTALACGAAAVACIFAGEELLRAAGASATVAERTLVQLLGAALFGLAMVYWANRFSRVGGILGRPLAIANFSHGLVAAFAILHLGRERGFSPLLVGALTAYALLALVFGAKLFGRAPER